MSQLEHLVRGIIVQNESILLCKNLAQGHYFLPGGHIEEGELPEQALAREMIEEIARIIKNTKHIVDISNSYTEKDIDYKEIAHVYLVTLENYEDIKGIEGHLAFEWIPLNTFQSIDFKPRKAVSAILADIETNKDFWK